VVIIDDVRDDEPLAQAYRETVGDFLQTSLRFEQSFMAVPLMLKDRIIGLLGLTSARPHYYTPHQGHLVLAIAQQAAIAMENARLYKQAQRVAAQEERQRLSRELHDSVSQALYSIALGAKTARTLLDRDPSAIAEPLDFVLSQAERGLAEMRALIFELRPEALEQEGLVSMLRKYADALHARHSVRVDVVLDGGEPEVPLSAKEDLYRIAQEAMHNAVRHAGAGAIRLTLRCEAAAVTLAVEDDGKGFDPHGSFPGHFGLLSMRERAANLGGLMQIESSPGSGTTISVTVPQHPAASA
jgi:signal transduction histidine kinase